MLSPVGPGKSRGGWASGAAQASPRPSPTAPVIAPLVEPGAARLEARGQDPRAVESKPAPSKGTDVRLPDPPGHWSESRPSPRPPIVPEAPPPKATKLAPTAPVVSARDDTTRLGDQLVGAGLISRDQLRVAMIEQKRTGAMLGQVLVDLGFLTDQTLAEIMAHNSGRDRFDPAATVADPLALAPLPEEMARRLRVFPVGYAGRILRLAMADPSTWWPWTRHDGPTAATPGSSPWPRRRPRSPRPLTAPMATP
ncbi:hypothetical protein [Pararhodospirillum photometricum]|uniref:GspE/PulE/PilB domain-containing protein n=1 Tax=Pararhodospirillum photometricum TaxID=1084 RepID=UPI000303CB84|nr:hypothetical protein [Pararhodospirillum photometricum]